MKDNNAMHGKPKPSLHSDFVSRDGGVMFKGELGESY